MYLSSLEILGFKSFANKTKFEFSEGLTGIVGPNGCGKSNIVDAIRWVLGEQKVSSLRSDKMENVIFNGTSKRKPLGMTEVSLTIENNKKILPIEFSEVIITRRLFRSGESQYLLNGQIVRLKDIQNLFMDTGMSTDAYSIIELKMIEMILSDNKEERRRLFEEAAGIKKYKIHRRVALRKLEQTQVELSRVNDLLAEVQRNVNSLFRQVAKTRRYQRLKEELKEKEIQLQLFKYYGYLDSRKPLEDDLEDFQNLKKKLSTEINQRESDLEKVKLETLNIEQDFQQIQREISNYKGQIDEIEKQNLLAEQQIEHLKKERERISSEYNYVVQRLQEIAGLQEEKQSQLDDLKEENYRIIAQLEEVEEEKSAAEQQLAELKEKIRELESENRNWQERLNQLSKDIGHFTTLIEARTNEIGSLSATLENHQSLLENKSKNRAQLETELKESEDELGQLEDQIAQMEKKKEQLELQERELRSQYTEQDKEVDRLSNEITIYENILQNYEGYSSAVKFVMDHYKSNGKLLETLPNTFRVTDSMKKVLGQFLQELTNVILVEDKEQLIEILDKVNNERVGQVGLMTINQDHRSFDLPKDDRLNPVVQYIEAEDQFTDVVKQIFSTVYQTESIEVAMEMAGKYPHCTFITESGFISGPFAYVKAGTSGDSGVDLIGRKSKIKNIKSVLQQSVEKKEQIENDLEGVKKELEELNRQILQEKEKKQQISTKHQSIKEYFQRANIETDSLEERIREEQALLNTYQSELKEYQEKLQLLKPQYDDLSLKYDEYEENIEEYKKELSYKEEDVRKISEEFNVKRIEKVQMENDVNRLEQELFNLSKEKEQLSHKKEKLEGEDEIEIQNQIASISKEIEERKTTLHELFGVYSEKNKIRESLEEQYQSLKNQLLEIEDEISNTRKKWYQAQEKIQEVEFKIQELGLKAQGVEEQLKEYYNYEIGERISMDSFNPEIAHQEISELRVKLERIGEVNPLAIEEYEKEKERLDFLKSQEADILKAEKQLLQTIDELNKTATEKFLDTYDAIKENFIKVFKEFFPQGEATLELMDPDDPLETDINIKVTPKGRKLQTLTLMSAGEKTLTAISLLFAIYLVKPSPFCILDEVDAPLDDVNIGRFSNALKGFSKNTQFIIVTHNKKTMEAVDAIYGVTMEEEGVSKVVSVQFK
ncbi:MAG: chromosome segregation protein SMC [Calditrichia bacterium]